MEKKEIRKALMESEFARKKLLQPHFLDLGLTLGQGQPRILRTLKQKGSMTQRELADLCRMDVTNMSRTLDRLEEAGLLSRKSNPSCRRSFLISLTEAGVKKAEEVKAIFKEADQMICACMDEDELEMLYASLCKIRGNFEQAAKKISEPSDEKHREK